MPRHQIFNERPESQDRALRELQAMGYQYIPRAEAEQKRGHLSHVLFPDTILKEASALKARMVVLETQTCNENAIAFYRRYGFEIIGFDLYSYSNTDPEKNEVRVEMGRKLG